MNESPDPIDVAAITSGSGLPLSQVEEAHGQLLREADPQEFLPSPDPLLRGAAWLLVVGFSAAAGLMAVWPYRVVVRGSGQVRPSGETSVIQAPFPARVSAVLVQPNQEVSGGQVLAQLDPSDLAGEHRQLRQSREALYRQAEAMQAEHQAARQAAALEVEESKAALQLAAAEYQRFQQLADTGSVAAIQLDAKRAAFDVAQINLQQAQQALREEQSQNRSAQAQLDRQLSDQSGDLNQAARDLGKTTIRAPLAGVLFLLNLRNPGQMLAAGEELARIAPTGVGSLVKVHVPAQEISNVEIGQHADLRVSGCPYPDYGTLDAEVMSVAPEASLEQGGYEVTLRPSSELLRSAQRSCGLRFGMDVRADIITKRDTVLGFLLRKSRLGLGL